MSEKSDPQAYKLADWIGYLTRPEVDFLIKIARGLPDKPTVINIGAGVGTSGMCFMEARKDLTLYTIDVNDHPNPYGGLVNERNAFEWSGFLGQERHIQICGDSKEIGKKWKKGLVDCVLVDGDHNDDGVRGDIENWIKHVKPGGVMIFHDYQSPFYGAVQAVVDQYFTKRQKVGQVDNLAAFRVKNA